jgi:hypothetical protein
MIGRLDVQNNIITHYTTPFTAIEGSALDPIGVPGGLVWVTPGLLGSPSDGIGSLYPSAGTFTLCTTPTAGSNPYGVAIGAAPAPWCSARTPATRSACLSRRWPAE